ncbi:hypothetical protein ACFS5J_02365 [Flavobacterium chuncheonense]|uniref:Uncharacterized protein n=1 Tax=Flavobacterium chuncheonense TaxID=2026653 RepID=A0ABW5YIZ5_9FLAO
MTANTAYEVFLALSEKERADFLHRIQEHFPTEPKKIRKPKNDINFNQDDAIQYLLKNVFNVN